MGQSALDCAGGRDCFLFLFSFLCKCIMQLITYLSIFTCAFCDCAAPRKLNGPGLRGQNFHSAANLVPEKGVVLGHFLYARNWLSCVHFCSGVLFPDAALYFPWDALHISRFCKQDELSDLHLPSGDEVFFTFSYSGGVFHSPYFCRLCSKTESKDDTLCKRGCRDRPCMQIVRHSHPGWASSSAQPEILSRHA